MNLQYYIESVLSLILLWLPAILGLSILTGFTGLFSFGHAGFIAIGAYASAMATKVYHLPFSVGIVVGCLIAVAASMVLGRLTLKLKGDYFCLATIGFGETIRQVISNMEWVGGSRGLQMIPKETTLLNVVTINVILVFLVASLITSRHGRNMVAVREEELAAQMVGINVFRSKMTALMLSAALAALSGALFAHSNQAIQPKDFGMDRSTELTIIVILGGVGSLSGSVVGAILLLSLPELFRDFQVWRLAIYGAVVVLIMIARPLGLMGGVELTPSGIRKYLATRRASREAAAVEGRGA